MKLIKIILFVSLPFALFSQGQPTFSANLYPTTIVDNGTTVSFTRNAQTTTVTKSDIGVVLFQTGAIVFNIHSAPGQNVYFQGLYADLTATGATTEADKKTFLGTIYSRASGGGGGGAGDASAANQTTEIARLTSIRDSLISANGILRNILTSQKPVSTSVTTNNYTAVQAITTTNVNVVIIENTGAANGTYTENGNTYTLTTGTQIVYDILPLPTLSVNGAGTSIKVTRYIK